MSIAICTSTEGPAVGPHCPLLLYAGGSVEERGSGFDSVQAEQGPDGYQLTNTYMDGVFGVSDDALMEAEVDESPCCPECSACVEHWEHR